MIVKILGLLDLLAAAVALFAHIGFLPVNLLYFFAFYLILKGAIFFRSLTSILDVACAAYLIAIAFGAKTFLVYLVALYLFQKAVFSFAS